MKCEQCGFDIEKEDMFETAGRYYHNRSAKCVLYLKAEVERLQKQEKAIDVSLERIDSRLSLVLEQTEQIVALKEHYQGLVENPWIPVTERLPKQHKVWQGVPYWVCFDISGNQALYQAYWYNKEWVHWDNNDNKWKTYPGPATHWQLLAGPPKRNK